MGIINSFIWIHIAGTGARFTVVSQRSGSRSARLAKVFRVSGGTRRRLLLLDDEDVSVHVNLMSTRTDIGIKSLRNCLFDGVSKKMNKPRDLFFLPPLRDSNIVWVYLVAGQSTEQCQNF